METVDMLPLLGIFLTTAYLGASIVLERITAWLRLGRDESIDVWLPGRRTVRGALRGCLLIEIAVALVGMLVCATWIDYATVAVGALTAAAWSMGVVHRAQSMQRAAPRRFS